MFLKKSKKKIGSGSKWLLLFVLVLCIVGCGKNEEGPEKLTGGKLDIPPKGGSASIVFEGQEGDFISIVLKANDMDCEPYGHLEDEEGVSLYVPQNAQAKGGKNSGETTLKSTSNYTLTIYDGSNRGCKVEVTVTKLPK